MKRRALWIALTLVIPLTSTREARAGGGDSPYLQVVGAISDTYGAFQAAEFVGTLFGIGASTEVQDAVTGLEDFMRNYRDQALVNSVMGDIGLFRTISSDYQNGLTDELEANFITNCQGDLAQLQGDIQTGTMDDAYLLAPAFNLLTVTYVGALTAFGIENPANAYPQDLLDSYLDAAMDLDYSLVGGVIVEYDLMNKSGSLFMDVTQGGKKMWPKYAYLNGDFFEPQYDALFTCDFTLPQNVDSDLFEQCYIDSDDQPFNLGLYPQALQDAKQIIDGDRGRFQVDPSVQAIGAAMNGLINLQHNIVTDWNTGSFGIGTGHLLVSL
jgi:hypothetical protein